MKDFSGVFTALVTPFKNGQIDLASCKKLIRFQIDHGVNGFVINGTTGESPTLNSQERKALFNFVKSEVSKEVPLVLGTGSASTEITLNQTKEAEALGADGVLIVTPYYNKPPQEGLYQHYKVVAESTPLPIILYNVPGRTGVSLSPETVASLSRIKNVVGIKEATGDMVFGKKILELCDKDFLVTSGDDVTFLDLTLQGGRGVISVLSHLIPSQVARFLKMAREGDSSCLQEFQKWTDLTRLLFKTANPIPVKAALKLMGIIESDELRLPLVALSGENLSELSRGLSKAGLI